mmetsp:Transcript_13849/g.60457  ORF Transcript_13849/g.60457 Transcript_13849/m.60457 type:complete len:83 (-) Transcript_13849:2266-2514(-)
MPCSWLVHSFEHKHSVHRNRNKRKLVHGSLSHLELAFVVEMLRRHSQILKKRCARGVREKLDVRGRLQHICIQMQLLLKETV